MALFGSSDRRALRSFAPSPVSTLPVAPDDSSIDFPYPPVVLSIDHSSAEAHRALSELPLEP